MISDIDGHIDTLARLAGRCNHVTEFGVRSGNSTFALIAGKPKTLVSYDVNPCPRIEELKRAAREAGVDFTFKLENTLTADIANTDMLFIDTVHTAEQVYAELTRHAAKVSMYLVFHDTETCAERDIGAPGQPLGLAWGIGRYMWEQRQSWVEVEHYTHSHGLAVYKHV